MTPQVLVRYLKSIFNDSSSIGQIPRIVYSMILKDWSDNKESIFNDSSSIGKIPGKVYSIFNDSSSIGQIPRNVYSMTPQVLVRYLSTYIQ